MFILSLLLRFKCIIQNVIKTVIPKLWGGGCFGCYCDYYYSTYDIQVQSQYECAVFLCTAEGNKLSTASQPSLLDDIVSGRRVPQPVFPSYL